MRATVSFEARVVACDECGAPLVLGPASGTEPCSFCGARHQRSERSRAVPRLPVTDERARLAKLAAQDARPVAAPREIAELAPGGQLLSWKVGDALARFKAARALLTTRHDSASAEQLYWLAKALADHFSEVEEPLRERALLESALDSLELSRQRQGLLSALSRSATRAGDFAAAESWLALCDPRSDDLEADSAYRFARAYLDTAAGRYDGVFAVLGHAPTEVPISSEHEAACVVLRANAWERAGQHDTAVELLDHFNRQASGVGRYLASRFAQRHDGWKLCERSMLSAELLQRARGVEAAGRAAGAPVVAIAMTLIFGAVGCVALLFAPFSLTAAVSVAYFLWLIGAASLVLTVFEIKNTRRARRLRLRGAPALAQVQHVRPGGQVTMGVPELRYRVLVLPPAGHPFEALSTVHATEEIRARLGLGAIALVRFDTDDRTRVQIEVD